MDREAVNTILDMPQVQIFEATHRDEHCLEVHLPFLQRVFAGFRLVPLVIGEASGQEVADVMDRLWGGDETVFVVSSDLSHYLDYDTARRVDAATCRAIEGLDPSSIGYDQACGRVPVAGLLTLARRRGLAVTTLDLRNSGDTAGDRRRVVGYGAWMFVEQAPTRPLSDRESDATETAFSETTARLLDDHGPTLLHLAAASVDHGLSYGRPLVTEVADYPADLRTDGACFVTLKRDGLLRGCVGSPEACRSLVEDVSENAFAAAFRDSRFEKLKKHERDGLTLSVTVLSPPNAIRFAHEDDLLSQLRPGIDGLVIQSDRKRSVFLPQVWSTLPDPRGFLNQLKVKAGLQADHWNTDFAAWRFVAETVSSETLPDPDVLWN